MMDSKKMFLTIEAVLAAMLVVLAVVMIRGKGREDFPKISVIVQNPDDNQWAAFRYGLKMAAEDQKIELFIVSTGGELTAAEEIEIINREIENGADAVIAQPVYDAGMSDDELEEMLKKLEKKIPVMLVQCTASSEREASLLPATEPDHYAMGRALAEEMLKDYSGNLEGKTVGIVTESAGSEAVSNRRKGVEDILNGTGASICWSVSDLLTDAGEDSLRAQPKVDFVIALDDYSLTTIGKYSAANDLHGALVYGIGNSTEAFYYLDTDVAECLVVSDEFWAGYQSLTETAKCLEHIFYKMKDQTVPYTVIRREELFSKENQEILFTMSQ